MSGRIAARLKSLGIELAAVPAPVANYVPFVRSGPWVFVSGQLPPARFAGIVGKDLGLDEARQAARAAAVNVLAVLSAAIGDLDKVARVVKLTGFVNAAPGFVQHPEVVNGASDLFVEVFGEAGRHARAAVGASSLPRNAAVEIDAVFEVA